MKKVRTVNIYERTSRTFGEATAIVTEDGVFLPIELLTDRWGLVRKNLPEGRVGICRKDICVPFSDGAGADSLRRIGEEVFVPAERLVKGLGGTIVWDATENDLLVDLAVHQTVGSAAVAQTLDLTLPDMNGNPVPLSSFRGKRILLFAWASW